jgi:hypothetical protein
LVVRGPIKEEVREVTVTSEVLKHAAAATSPRAEHDQVQAAQA